MVMFTGFCLALHSPTNISSLKVKSYSLQQSTLNSLRMFCWTAD